MKNNSIGGIRVNPNDVSLVYVTEKQFEALNVIFDEMVRVDISGETK